MKQTELIISTTPLSLDVDESEEASADAEWRTLEMSTVQHGERLDRALVAGVPEFSRSYLQQLIDAGLVTVNGHVVLKTSQKVKIGDKVVIELRPTPQSQAFKPEDIPLQVVYEDEYILIIDKPAGLVVHPAPGNWSGTLLNALLFYDAAFSSVPRAGIVHRLDKDTSGLMVVARTRSVMDALVQAIAAREVSRQYIALGHKSWTGRATVCVNAPVGRDPKNRLRMAVVDLDRSPGKSAKTDFILLGNTEGACFVRCILHTGRTHQIRVHMSSLGHPLIADLVYGGQLVDGLSRQALHACRLALVHPVNQNALVFESQPPADLLGILEGWGLSYNPTIGVLGS